MRQIVKMTYGSHLYGTSTPASDRDFKGVHLPTPVDILLQRSKGSFSEKTKTDRHVKNTAEDVDFESFALHKFLGMVADGSSTAYEMLFAPQEAILQQTSEWSELQGHRERFITTKVAEAFIGYMRRQAAKYGVKGSRMATVRAALATLDSFLAGTVFDPKTPLFVFREGLELFCSQHAHALIVDIKHPSGKSQPHWEIITKKFPLGLGVGEARRVLQSIFDNYGSRTRAAEENQGIDWKAVGHAVRVGGQALELLRRGTITFPRPDVGHLLEIKEGRLGYSLVSAELEALIDEVQHEASRSGLPTEFNWELADAIVLARYQYQVMHEMDNMS